LSNRKVSFFTPKLRLLPDKLARGAIGLIATCANFKTFVPVGQADWGREKLGTAILAAYLLHQLDKPAGGKTKLGEQKRIV